MATLSYLTTTHFDFGALSLVGKEMKRLNVRRPLVVTDAGVVGAGLLARLEEQLNGMEHQIYSSTPANPTEAAVLSALDQFSRSGCDGIICMGGGSPMDLGKAVALLAGNGGPLARFEPSSGGAKLIERICPIIAIPTTSGTGSEVSVGAVIILDDGRKATFASPKLIPAVAICDPDLTMSLPPQLTAATGMDAITHCIEAVLSPVVNPPAEGVGLDGLWRGWRNIESAVKDGRDKEARWQMMMASTEGAMAFVKGLGAVHALSHSAGRLPNLRLHHGTLNAVFLPAVLRFNRDSARDKYERLTTAMNLPQGADLADAVAERNAQLGLPAGLSAMGVAPSMMEDLVRFAELDLAGRTNPRQLTRGDFETLIVASM